MKTLKNIYLACFSALALSACHKAELAYISPAVVQVSNAITSDTLKGAIKGTMLAGKTYYFSKDITVNDGDTLQMQAGVRLIALGDGKTYQTAPAIIMHGTFISLGTKENPNYITVQNSAALHTEAEAQNYSNVFQGWWGGIICTPGPVIDGKPVPTGGDVVLKWTHLEFAGGPAGPGTLDAYTEGDPRYVIYFANITKNFILEDSWLFGSKDDGIRVAGGKISVMRNTFELCGQGGGEFFNMKSGTLGDLAYNFMIGAATNALKASDAGGSGIQTNVNMYNNTIVNCGFRQTKSGRGGSINFEKAASGQVYNNLIANCRFGLRVTKDADLQNMKYNNQYFYGVTTGIAGQFLASDGVATFQPGDIHSDAAKDNDPLFYGYDLTKYDYVANPGPLTVSAQTPYVVTVGTSNFRLQAASKGLGAGKVDFQPMAAVTTTGDYGTTITPPGKDIGAYQNDGTGNQH
ncbi:hypothetical protein SAMN05216464_11260 [Mucilaginibacter pineti]|uniref:Right handed beta helix region n=1 Tax=Mucilaginibacter pineti TaxID=1391627 RepID=A0A1G7HWY7_9SPHI|nr:hypothetical protein [Mucilaginibacter pineti]SDF04962.1 hypothetical protein SAMN05216464_11260 [Mucilaginibacter pineti]